MARILLVEDDDALSRGLVALLDSEGYSVDPAHDGATALYMASQEIYPPSRWMSACPTCPVSTS